MIIASNEILITTLFFKGKLLLLSFIKPPFLSAYENAYDYLYYMCLIIYIKIQIAIVSIVKFSDQGYLILIIFEISFYAI